MEQPTFADVEYESKKAGRTRREVFLERMDGLIPWQRPGGSVSARSTLKLVEGVSHMIVVMLRVHCVQLFYNLSDPGKGGPALRGGVGAAVRGTAAVGGAARREHDTALPSYPGGSMSWGGSV